MRYGYFRPASDDPNLIMFSAIQLYRERSGTSFNGTGAVVLKVSPTEDDAPRGCDLQSDNKMFCTIQPTGNPVFQRFNDNGTVDTTFGPSGCAFVLPWKRSYNL
jgi:hypothetical protein